MSFQTTGSSRIQEALAHSTSHPDYDQLPESIKLIHTPEQYAWLGTERERVIDRECMPDNEVTE